MVLTAVLFVALLVPLMIPRVPYKALNAIVFFGVFPIVGFMLLIGTALPFGLIGLLALIVDFVIWLRRLPCWASSCRSRDISSAASARSASMVGLPDAVPFLLRRDRIVFYRIARLRRLAVRLWRGKVTRLRGATENTGRRAVAVDRPRHLGLAGDRPDARGCAFDADDRDRRCAWSVGRGDLASSGSMSACPMSRPSLWGGLLVTLVLSFVGIAVSLPLGIVLALGRRSKMPVIKMISVIFIEAVRGVPLVTVLFMASVMLPLFLPPGVTFDKFLRALIGVALFASAYMAEVIRGGLQAIPKGQYEGADSLGLGYWQKMGLIVLPQALKLVIPGIVNTFIGLFKDTSLVSIIGMFDLLGIVRQGFSDANWASPQTPMTGLVFAGFVFWLFCFGMSRYSIYMERRLDTGHKR